MTRGARVALYYGALAHVGGAERQWAEELRALTDAGVPSAGLIHRAEPGMLRELGLRAEDVSILPNGGPIKRILATRAWLRQVRPEAILAHSSHQLVYLATRGLGIPFILYQNSPPFYGDFDLNPFIRAWRHRAAYARLSPITRGFVEFHHEPTKFGWMGRGKLELRALLEVRAMHAASGVFVLSQRTANEVRELYGVESAVIRGCLDLTVLRPGSPGLGLRASLGLPSGPLCLSVCRLDAVKRVDLAIRALKHAQRDVPDASLIIVGTGKEANKLRDTVASMGVRNVVFAGYVADEHLGPYYAAANLFVSPATADFNIAPYEAVAQGLRALISDELEVEDWLLKSGWMLQSEPTAEAFGSSLVAAFRREPPVSVDLQSLTWAARAESIVSFLEGSVGVSTGAKRTSSRTL